MSILKVSPSSDFRIAINIRTPEKVKFQIKFQLKTLAIAICTILEVIRNPNDFRNIFMS